MKKAVLLMLSLFSALSLMFLSCSTDSSGGGSDPEFDVTICNGAGDEKTEFSAISGSDINIYVTSKNYFNALDVKSANYYDEETEDIENLSLSFVQTYTERSLHKYSLAVPNKAGSFKVSITFNKVNTTVTKTLDIILNTSSSSEEKAVPVIKTQPQGKTYATGTTEFDALTVVATISDDSTPVYQWYNESGKIDGATNASYKPTAEGKYYVIVYNSSDKTKFVKSEPAVVHVKAVGELDKCVIVSNLEKEISYDKVDEIKTLSIVAEPTVADEVVNYQWYKDSEKLDGETKSSYEPTTFGSYYVEIWASKGDNKSAIEISNTCVISESEIEINVSSLGGTTAYIGDTLTVTATTNIDGNITYQWYTTDSTSGDDRDISGATDSSYTPEEVGKYGCSVTVKSKVTGISRSTQKAGVCDVKEKDPNDPATPIISSEPIDVSCEVGESITLSVTATRSDTGVLTYQWYKGTAALNGATSATYTKSNCSATDAGEYYVIVTNTLNSKKATKKSRTAIVTISGTGDVGGGFDFN